MVVLEHMSINRKLEKLQCTFPKLSEANQHYVLGLAEGLKQAQKGKEKSSQKEMGLNLGKQINE
jgi:hypothetical protein